ncbi:MAG: hypothetical protein M3198_14120 [Actinomycetota bacterium]|nr:hypothetical protein [Actinomycetota bacterium]
MSDQNRGRGVAIDLDRLEAHAESLYLTRFVDAIKAARGTHGRFLVLRSGDETAIRAAEDGSFELLDEVRVPEEESPS